MIHGGGGRPRGGRQMTPDEAELWRQLAHSLDKVKTKPRVAPRDAGLPAPPGPPVAALREAPICSRAARAVHTPSPAAPPAVRSPAEFDRRTRRLIATGRVPIEARLDLHGLNQAAAHARLRRFLANCQSNGHRMVLVITGKGGVRPLTATLPSSRERSGEGFSPSSWGVLRRSVPQWLKEPEFTALVLGYAAAGVEHGGDGALYIRLRKAREA